MKFSRILCSLALPVVVAACTQPETVPAIQGDLLFDKYGGESGCTQGRFIPGAPPELQCLPPDDQCDPQNAAFDPDCPPPLGREPNGDDGLGPQPNPTAGRI